MKNYAGCGDKDTEIAAELEAAGIEVQRLPESFRDNHPEMRTIVFGTIGPWSFKRAWYYWVAKGPGIPPVEADKLQESHGSEVRADGDCACRGPRFWSQGFAAGVYHVDTEEGLKALADTIRSIFESRK
jgi:hypothetical protein